MSRHRVVLTFDNCTVQELLHGELMVEINAEWDGDRLVATIEGEVPAPDNIERGERDA